MTPSNNIIDSSNDDWLERSRRIVGNEGIQQLQSLHVLVVGIGGVGAYAAEMLVRSGIGEITIVDGDEVSVSNINRQLIATTATLGKRKTDVMAERLIDINPRLSLHVIDKFLTVDDIIPLLEDTCPDFVVDAIDSVAPKVALIENCLNKKIKIISSGGSGGRLDPTKIGYADLWATSNDGLLRAVRDRLKQHGFRGKKLPVVWSSEQPLKNSVMMIEGVPNKRSSYGTISYLPCIFGCNLAAWVINQALKL